MWEERKEEEKEQLSHMHQVELLQSEQFLDPKAPSLGIALRTSQRPFTHGSSVPRGF